MTCAVLTRMFIFGTKRDGNSVEEMIELVSISFSDCSRRRLIAWLRFF